VPASFDYAVFRIVPRVEREEFINAGVIVYCAEQRFLAARVYVDEARLKALWPDLDINLVRQHLEAVTRIASGDPSAGPIARLAPGERFHWLVAPRSTMIQVSPVHSGICEAPAEALERLLTQLLSV